MLLLAAVETIFLFFSTTLQCNHGERLVHVEVGGGPATGRCERFPLPVEANSNEARVLQCVSAIIFCAFTLTVREKKVRK